MDISTLLFKALLAPTAKVILKGWFKDSAWEFGSGTIDFLSDQAAASLSTRERRKIHHHIDDIVAGILDKLAPIFAAENAALLHVEAVTRALETALHEPRLSHLIVQEKLQPDAVFRAMQKQHPIGDQGLSEAEQALYTRALRLIVPQLIEIANRLPSFDAAHAQATFTQLATLAATAETILAQVQPVAEIAAHVRTLVEHIPSARTREAEAEAFERAYMAALRRHWNYFDLMGIADPEETEALELSVAYISLNLSYTGHWANQSTALPFDRLLAHLTPEDRGLLIEGPAGSGKTTRSRWAVLNAGQPAGIVSPGMRDGRGRMQEHLLHEEHWEADGESGAGRHDDDNTWQHRIPFFIRLRDYPDGQLPPLATYGNLSAPHAPPHPPDWVEHVLDAQRALVIWDGADEVPRPSRRDMLRAIGDIIEQHPGNLFLLTTRPGIRPGWIQDLRLPRAEIAPMAALDVEQFVARWHQAAAHVLRRRDVSSPVDMLALGQALIRQFYDEPAILRLAANPLLCSAICSLHYQDRGHLPNKQHRLCEKLCEMLLHGRDLKRGIVLSALPKPYASLGYEEKKRIARHLAYEMVQNGRSSITVHEAQNLIREQLPTFSAVTADDAEIVTTTLVERGGLLRARQATAVEFVHNTLKEFLAAEGFTTGLVDRLVNNALQATGQDESAWHNVAVFASALGSEVFTSSLIQALLDKELGTRQDRRRLILVLRCMAATTALSPALRQRQRELEQQLFPPHDLTEASRLAYVGDHVVRFLRPQPGGRMKAEELAACVRALRLIGTAAARSALQDYLPYRQKRVIHELIRAVNPLDIPVVIEENHGVRS